MASESSEEQTVTVNLPAELNDWLDEHARTLELDRGTLLVQLLASYRATAQLDGDVDEDSIALTPGVADVESQIDEQVETEVEEHLTDRLSEATKSVQKQLDNRIDTVERDFQEKLADVRERVVQVKKETDTKAPREHTHEELGRLQDVARRVETLETEVEHLQKAFDETVSCQEKQVSEMEDSLEEVQDRLQTVAWVVNDLRDARERMGGLEAVERIKRAAARADVDRANCENCGESVAIALLTDPECPHCNATVTNVEPASGWFRKPKLLAASQLEAGDDE